MKLFFEFVIASCATLSFAFYFNCPQKSLVYNALLGGFVWTLYSVLLNYSTYIFSAFISAVVMGCVAEQLARLLKMPATVFLLPGLVPLVPGAGMYYTMYNFIFQNYSAFVNEAVKTVFMAGALAAGVVVSSSVFKILRYYKL
ncbi:threonine/serine exporter family protein [Peptoniphilus equinus]|uniref:Threonine/serine exporter family protein n=1 Tax=Peptoniphilus equinus TaxID=3016343 RepID=A0ABY7QVA4_9FIRM|nr:threonine/serine exporter family protein [Peptoniphilus equinus]WBW50722.1 threonine/serine exporter family protein [Peptoniphilus equinus]